MFTYPKECGACPRDQGQLHRSPVTSPQQILARGIHLSNLHVSIGWNTRTDAQLHTRITAMFAWASPIIEVKDRVGDDIVEGEVHAIGTSACSSSDAEVLASPVGILGKVADMKEV
jgi:hypothetical protein